MTEHDEGRRWIEQWDGDTRGQVEELAGWVRAADPRIETAVKWKRLTFTVDGNWHHWLCGIAVTRAGVHLQFHKGSFLADPESVLSGDGRYLRTLSYERAAPRPEVVAALVRDAIAHQTDMLPAD